MLIVQKLAGFSMGRADVVRKAMEKEAGNHGPGKARILSMAIKN